MEILRWFMHGWCPSYVWPLWRAANVNAGVAVNEKWTHCLIQREALVSQQLSGDLNRVLKAVVKTVNFIKARPLKARVFQRLCGELGAEHNNLLFYCNARWLSKGKVLLRVYKLRNKISIFLKEENHAFATIFEDEVFLTQLVYLCNIFLNLNQLNISSTEKKRTFCNSMTKLQPLKENYNCDKLIC